MPLHLLVWLRLACRATPTKPNQLMATTNHTHNTSQNPTQASRTHTSHPTWLYIACLCIGMGRCASPYFALHYTALPCIAYICMCIVWCGFTLHVGPHQPHDANNHQTDQTNQHLHCRIRQCRARPAMAGVFGWFGVVWLAALAG